jgi:hypothetical protein
VIYYTWHYSHLETNMFRVALESLKQRQYARKAKVSMLLAKVNVQEGVDIKLNVQERRKLRCYAGLTTNLIP